MAPPEQVSADKNPLLLNEEDASAGGEKGTQSGGNPCDGVADDATSLKMARDTGLPDVSDFLHSGGEWRLIRLFQGWRKVPDDFGASHFKYIAPDSTEFQSAEARAPYHHPFNKTSDSSTSYLLQP